jgi:hypothetical protein
VSPVAEVYESLRALNASWSVELGRPEGAGWIAGDDFRNALSGPLNELLERIGARAKTDDRRTIAASFALRFGWSSAMAIAPYLRFGVVPDVALGNIALRFRESAFFECTAVYEPRGVVVASDPRADHPSMKMVRDETALLRALRDQLVEQAAPVVATMYEWSGFAERATWGMLTSSWASHFTGLWEARDDQRPLVEVLDRFFAGDDVVAGMRPGMNPVEYGGAIHLYQRRASCCRYYLLPEGDLCASCPLVSDEERAVRNLDWMRTQAERAANRRGHN